MKKGTYLILGVLVLAAGLFFVLLTVVAAVEPSLGAPAAALMGTCSAVFLVPAAILLYLWWRASAEDKVLQTVGAVLRSVREITVQDLAAKLKKTPAETEVLISKTVAAGYAQGVLDPREGKFVATAWGTLAPGQVPQIIIQAPSMPAAYYPPGQAGPSFGAPTATGAPESRFCRECGSRIERVPGQEYWKCPHCGNVQ